MPIYTTYLAYLKRFNYNPQKVFPSKAEPVVFYYVMRNRGHNEVAPPEQLLRSYKQHEITWKEYEAEYLASLDERVNPWAIGWMQKRAEEAKTMHVILVCFEKNPDKCHRRLLAETIAEQCNAEYKGDLSELYSP